MDVKFLLHYGFHFLVPLFVAYFFYQKKWKLTYLIMMSTMLIDFDHLLANPIYDPNRCSINFHPLHTYYAIGVYFLLLIPKKVRVIGIGLLIHIAADWIDCFL